MSKMIEIEVDFSDLFYKKLGLKSHDTYEKALDNTIDHATHDAENTCRRESPIDTGNLRRSIHKNKPGKCQGEILAQDAPYWVYLQWGTSKMDANPFVSRTISEVGPKLPKYFHEELKHMGVL